MFSQIQMTSIHLLQPQPSCEIQTQPLSKTAPLATAPQALASQSGRDTHQQPLSQSVSVLLPKVSLTTEVPIGDILCNLLLSDSPCLSRAGWTRWAPDVPSNTSCAVIPLQEAKPQYEFCSLLFICFQPHIAYSLTCYLPIVSFQLTFALHMFCAIFIFFLKHPSFVSQFSECSSTVSR